MSARPGLGVEAFSWRDGPRLVRFGRGLLGGEPPDELGSGYTLLSTARARAALPAIESRAAAVHEVAVGRVDEVAGALRAQVAGEHLVALGGGRVIDVAKALAAADGSRRVSAIPTTLSSAEMTILHRQAAGVPAGTPLVRPTLVLNDPAVCASQPVESLAASALNALAHAVEATLTPMRSPVTTLSAHRAAALIVAAFAGGRGEPDRDSLALGSLLAGYAVDSAGYGLHHVMSQSIVRIGPIGHGPANAILLPHTLRALERRYPAELETLAVAIAIDPIEAASRILSLTRAQRLGEEGVDEAGIEQAASAAAERFELGLTPPRASRDELLEIYSAAL